MRNLPFVAFLALLPACGGLATSGSGDAAASERDAAEASSDVAMTAPEAGRDAPNESPPPGCTDCLAKKVAWGQNGGLTTFTASSSLSPCRSYTFVEATSSAPPKSCTVELGGCHARPIAVGDVELALANAGVVAAFASGTPLYGTDPRPCDGSVLSITTGGHTIEVGGDCGSGACIAGSPCVPVPPAVRALADLLTMLDQQSRMVGECAKVFP